MLAFRRGARSTPALDVRCRDRLAELALPGSAGIREFAAAIEQRRGRSLWIMAASWLPPHVSGVWVADSQSDRDIVWHREGLEGVSLRNTVGHELSHVAFEHRSSPVVTTWLRNFCPAVDQVGAVEHVCMRTDAIAEPEREAEMLATLFLARADPAAHLLERDLSAADLAARRRIEEIFRP